MKTLRFALPLLALAGLLASGCILTSAQVLATYELPNPVVIQNGVGLQALPIDLGTVKDYSDNKSKLKGVVDLAVLGRFVNQSGSPALGVTLYMTRDLTNISDAGTLVTDPRAIKLWGPFNLPAGASTTDITWDRSAALFGPGRAALIDEIKGDGTFTLYAVCTTGTFNVRIASGALVAVLDAGM